MPRKRVLPFYRRRRSRRLLSDASRITCVKEATFDFSCHPRSVDATTFNMEQRQRWLFFRVSCSLENRARPYRARPRQRLRRVTLVRVAFADSMPSESLM